jgi:hypothetical protein
METKYLSCAETAKLIRAALKKAFPGVKFSVRSSTYSMGASIDVGWTDGPCAKAVEAVTGCYAGANFDGMIDLKNTFTSWLMPDGSACVASDSGTTGSMGTIPPTRNWMPDPEAKLVHFGANFVFCQRKHSPALVNRVRERLAAKGYPVEAIEVVVSDYDGAAHWKLIDYSKPRGFDMEREMAMAVGRTHCMAAS